MAYAPCSSPQLRHFVSSPHGLSALMSFTHDEYLSVGDGTRAHEWGNWAVSRRASRPDSNVGEPALEGMVDRRSQCVWTEGIGGKSGSVVLSSPVRVPELRLDQDPAIGQVSVLALSMCVHVDVGE